MRYQEISATVETLKKTKALDKPTIRKAIKVMKNPKKTSKDKFNALWVPFEVYEKVATTDIGFHFQEMKTISRKPWSYVANRMNEVLLSKAA